MKYLEFYKKVSKTSGRDLNYWDKKLGEKIKESPNKQLKSLRNCIKDLKRIKTDPVRSMLYAANSQRIVPILRCNTDRMANHPALEIVYQKPLSGTTILVHRPQSHDSDLEEDLDLNP